MKLNEKKANKDKVVNKDIKKHDQKVDYLIKKKTSIISLDSYFAK